MELTPVEKYDLIKQITVLVSINVLNREDRDDIFRVCLVACDREMAKVKHNYRARTIYEKAQLQQSED